MTWFRLPVLMSVIACASLGWADEQSTVDRPTLDLTKIDRSLAKEPAYTKTPLYALLVFGMKAETRVWLVQDGKTLYVDRDGNGDITPADEAIADSGTYFRSFLIEKIMARDGTVYKNLRVNILSSGTTLSVVVPDKGTQMVGPLQAAKPDFSLAAKEAPIIHFDGPLKITQYSDKRVISRSSKGSDRDRALRIMVGTPGLGKGTFAAFHCSICNSHGSLSAKFDYTSESGSSVELTEPLLKIG